MWPQLILGLRDFPRDSNIPAIEVYSLVKGYWGLWVWRLTSFVGQNCLGWMGQCLYAMLCSSSQTNRGLLESRFMLLEELRSTCFRAEMDASLRPNLKMPELIVVPKGSWTQIVYTLAPKYLYIRPKYILLGYMDP